MIIRPVKKEDLNQIIDLENKCFKHPYSMKDIEYEMFANPVSKFMVIEDEGKIIGFNDYWITFDSSTISQICVDPNYRLKGLGKMMMLEMIKDLKENEVLTTTLEVRKSNVGAIKFYESLGFYKVNEKKNYYSDQEDAIYMLLEVSNV